MCDKHTGALVALSNHLRAEMDRSYAPAYWSAEERSSVDYKTVGALLVREEYEDDTIVRIVITTEAQAEREARR